MKSIHGSASILSSVLSDWGRSWADYMPHVITAVVIFLLFWLFASMSRKACRHFEEHFKDNLNLLDILSWILYGFFMISGIFLALDVLKLTPFLTHILAGAGIVGIVAGFALKDISSNLFASILIRFQHPYRAGDWVRLNGMFGQVEYISPMCTAITSIEGQRVFIPNQLIYTGNFFNYSSYGKWRVIVRCGVSYGDDLEHVQDVVLDEITNFDFRLEDTAVELYFTDIGSSTYNFETRFWIPFVAHTQYLLAISRTIMHLKKRFEKENICVAYNVMTLDFGGKGGVNLDQTTVPIVMQAPHKAPPV